jgi:RNA polymerase sigma-70 factor (ECF subfamily)
MDEKQSETSISLLQRLGKQDPLAWDEFVKRYLWMMTRWLRSWDISIDDVEDLLQESCLRVFRNIHRFQRRGRGSFRAWLKKVSRSCWLQVVRKSAMRARLEHREFDLAYLLSEEILSSIDTQIDLLIEQEFLDHAMARTRQNFNDAAWNSYRMTALDGHSGAEVAEQLGISINLVYKNRERFEAHLERELKSICNSEG